MSEQTGYLMEPWLLNVLLWDLKEIKTIVCILVSYMFGELDILLGLKPTFISTQTILSTTYTLNPKSIPKRYTKKGPTAFLHSLKHTV